MCDVIFISFKCFLQTSFAFVFSNLTKCYTGNMISSTFKLLSLTTLIFILNTMFYLPPSHRRKHNVKNLSVHLNYSETVTESSELSKNIITESVKIEGMKYILYWNEAYDSKGEPTYITYCLAYLICFFQSMDFAVGISP